MDSAAVTELRTTPQFVSVNGMESVITPPAYIHDIKKLVPIYALCSFKEAAMK